MKIILYSNHCPLCNVLQSQLVSKNLEFDEFNDIDEMIKKGMSHMPMLEVDGELLNYSDALAWVKKQ